MHIQVQYTALAAVVIECKAFEGLAAPAIAPSPAVAKTATPIQLGMFIFFTLHLLDVLHHQIMSVYSEF